LSRGLGDVYKRQLQEDRPDALAKRRSAGLAGRADVNAARVENHPKPLRHDGLAGTLRPFQCHEPAAARGSVAISHDLSVSSRVDPPR